MSNKRLLEMWTTVDDLRAKVSLSLLKAIGEDEAEGNPRPGWYRGNQLPSPATMDELARLSAENRSLRAELTAAKNRVDSAVIPHIFQPEANGDMDGMPTIFCEVQNHGDTSFRIVEAEATWWFVDPSTTRPATRPAIVKVRPRFAKSGEKCDVLVLMHLAARGELDEYRDRLMRSQRESPVEAELVVTCESPTGIRKVERRIVRKYLGQKPWSG